MPRYYIRLHVAGLRVPIKDEEGYLLGCYVNRWHSAASEGMATRLGIDCLKTEEKFKHIEKASVENGSSKVTVEVDEIRQVSFFAQRLSKLSGYGFYGPNES